MAYVPRRRTLLAYSLLALTVIVVVTLIAKGQTRQNKFGKRLSKAIDKLLQVVDQQNRDRTQGRKDFCVGIRTNKETIAHILDVTIPPLDSQPPAQRQRSQAFLDLVNPLLNSSLATCTKIGIDVAVQVVPGAVVATPATTTTTSRGSGGSTSTTRSSTTTIAKKHSTTTTTCTVRVDGVCR